MRTSILAELSLGEPEPGWSASALRGEVRAFLEEQRAAGAFTPRCDGWLSGFSPEFSELLGRQGWLGMTWPRPYGGQERSGLERFVVLEELLAAGAPVAAHWVAERQSGPSILKYGTEEQRRRFLPLIASGTCYFAIGMSEPESGSDLASVRSRAVPRDGGWELSGTKVWTSHAHHAHHAIVLCRTGDESGRAALSQVIVDLSAPGVTVRPIPILSGEHHFNEVVFDGAFVPDDQVLGAPGEGWRQVTSELALERSGPERYLSTLPLLTLLAERAREAADPQLTETVGALVAEAWGIRQLSARVAAALDAGSAPETAAAIVKDLGTLFENRVVDAARYVTDVEPGLDAPDPFARMLAYAVLHAPGFTLRGGTSEILRGIVAKKLVPR